MKRTRWVVVIVLLVMVGVSWAVVSDWSGFPRTVLNAKAAYDRKEAALVAQHEQEKDKLEEAYQQSLDKLESGFVLTLDEAKKPLMKVMDEAIAKATQNGDLDAAVAIRDAKREVQYSDVAAPSEQELLIGKWRVQIGPSRGMIEFEKCGAVA